jgi:Zn-dependent protease
VRHIPWDALSSICVMDAIRLNLMLAVFNMLPVPPLDGHRVLGFFLPSRVRDAFYSFGQYGFVLLLLLMMRGTLDPVMSKIFTSVDHVWMNLMPDHTSIFERGR